MVQVNQMCSGCCESMMSSSCREASHFSTVSTTLSLLYSLRERRRRENTSAFCSSLDFWVTLLSGCLASGYIVLSTVPVIFRAVAHFHSSMCNKSLFFKENSSWLMSGAGEEFCEDLISDSLHSCQSQIKGQTFTGFFFPGTFPLSSIKDEWN